ncbi:hypothetical protein B0T22DRAFT_441616 [Podospora appendiculata]|uniref:Uncharacterized protein n=1 Tax=Podospora appendiculata TaxID=314037 RepID=A0AAE0XD03_9PEZI|nr:hypothetical protein B0T22DRAFT_441616 [Podospora appendiculata]
MSCIDSRATHPFFFCTSSLGFTAKSTLAFVMTANGRHHALNVESIPNLSSTEGFIAVENWPSGRSSSNFAWYAEKQMVTGPPPAVHHQAHESRSDPGNFIRAAALSCQRSLSDFPDIISKFETRLSSGRMQRGRGPCLLSSQVATTNLRLMTRAVRSIAATKVDHDRFALGMQSKLAVCSRLLQSTQEKQQKSTSKQQAQSAALDGLNKAALERAAG